MPGLTPAIEAETAALWDQARRARPDLFNGTVFSADNITPTRIEGHWTEYRRVLAQMRMPDLFAALRIRALAVNGLLECADGFVVGRREPGSIYQPGAWQGAPAGSVERRCDASSANRGGNKRIDLAEQILAECEEELGLEARDIVVLRPLAAVEHPGSHVVDIGLLLRTGLDFAQVRAAWESGGNREYDQLHLLGADTQPGGLPLTPSTRAMLACLRKSPTLE
jgi:hypothetical protein